MRQKTLLICSVLFLHGLSGSAIGKEPQQPQHLHRPGWKLIWHDEFEGTKIDLSKWGVLQRDLKKNKELQYYLKEDVYLQNGNLVLRSRKNRFGRRDYTSGHVDTQESWQYGRFEIRAQLPGTKGLWPAHWLLPSDRKTWPPEIDIMEMLGHKPTRIYMTNHFGVHPNNYREGRNFEGPDFTSDFHTFSFEWEPDEMRWFIDDTLHFKTRQNIPHEPFYMILNTAVGGKWPGNPDATTVLPQYHLIDYVRIYEPDMKGMHYLTVSSERGKVVVHPLLSRYPDGSQVTCEAIPEIGFRFEGWSGHGQGRQNPLKLAIHKTMHVKARFQADPRAPRIISKNAKVRASSELRAWYAAKNTVDGKNDSRWASEKNSPQWLAIDLGKSVPVKAVRLGWDVDYATDYKIQASRNGRTWETLVHHKEGSGRVEEYTGFNKIYKYVRIYCIKSKTPFGYSLKQFEVFG